MTHTTDGSMHHSTKPPANDELLNLLLVQGIDLMKEIGSDSRLSRIAWGTKANIAEVHRLMNESPLTKTGAVNRGAWRIAELVKGMDQVDLTKLIDAAAVRATESLDEMPGSTEAAVGVITNSIAELLKRSFLARQESGK